MKKKTVQKMQKKGLSNVDIAKIQKLAKNAAKNAENEAMEKAFMLMIWIPINILAADYWEKTAKKRIPEFVSKVSSLYGAVQWGVVSFEEIQEDIERLSGMRITTDWLKGV